MKTRQTAALALAMMIAGAMTIQPVIRAAQDGAIAGTAKKEARKPFKEYTVRARNVQQGQIAATVALDDEAKFSLPGVEPAKYLVELLDRDGKVVCTEGPFDLTRQPVKDDVNIECGKPAAWWLLAAAGAAGITAGVVANDPASPAR